MVNIFFERSWTIKEKYRIGCAPIIKLGKKLYWNQVLLYCCSNYFDVFLQIYENSSHTGARLQLHYYHQIYRYMKNTYLFLLLTPSIFLTYRHPCMSHKQGPEATRKAQIAKLSLIWASLTICRLAKSETTKINLLELGSMKEALAIVFVSVLTIEPKLSPFVEFWQLWNSPNCAKSTSCDFKNIKSDIWLTKINEGFEKDVVLYYSLVGQFEWHIFIQFINYSESHKNLKKSPYCGLFKVNQETVFSRF